jgi:hypothetical protein
MEPFTRGQAWVDLLMLAQTKPGWIIVRGISVDLDRGQVGYSELSLSERWKWSRNKVRLFIDTLRKRQMVDVKKDNKTTIITILNFDSYQSRQTAEGTANDTANGTAEGQQKDSKRTLTRKKEGKKERIKTEESIPHGDAVTDDNPEDFYLTKKKRKLTGKRLAAFNRFWTAFAYPKGKAEAADAWIDIPTLTDALVDEIVAAASAEAANRHALIDQGHTPKWAQGWISGRRWEDKAVQSRELTPEERTARDLAEMRRIRAQSGGLQ